ncbi:MAG TPA: pilin [Candidatus Moranbacteria bacterium]|nr:pilin [Candidatus Moranbacteria bacterium]
MNFKQKIFLIFPIVFTIITFCFQETNAATMAGDHMCSSVETTSGNCATLCASGLFDKKYGDDGLFSGWICRDKASNDKTCSEDKNCTSGYCNSTTKKCETKAGVTGTELPGGSVCSNVDGDDSVCAAICASGLSERKTGITGSFKNYSCVAQKSTGGACTSDQQCVSTTCDQNTKKCVAKAATTDTTSTDGTGTSGTGYTKADDSISGTATGGGLVTCGRSGGSMCHLCDLIVGIHGIIDYLLKIAIGIAVLAICIGGVLYVVSVGEPGIVEMGKKAMKNAIIGFVVALSAYLIVNVVMTYIGTNTDLGIGVQGWSQFNCSANSSS